jgi:hypothetical protein
MDSEEGDNEDPLSLHKYLYCSGDPADHSDPSGHEDGDVISLTATMGVALAIGTFLYVADQEMKNHAVGNLMQAAWNQTVADAGSATAAAESALSVARTSCRKLIKEAQDILRQTGQALKKVKVVPVPECG